MHSPTLTLTIAPSRWLRIAGLALHLLAVVAVLLADLVIWVRVLLLLAVAFSMLLHLRRSLPVQLRCEADGSLQVWDGADWRLAILQPSTMVTPTLTVLHYRVEDMSRTHHLAILPDSLPGEDFRHLRVWLRWKAGVSTGAATEATGRSADTPIPRS